MKHLLRSDRIGPTDRRISPRKLAVAVAVTLMLAIPAMSAPAIPKQAIQAQDAEGDDDWEQQWAGTLDTGRVKLRVHLQASRDEAGNYQGHLISLDQGNVKLKLKSFSIGDGKMSFELVSPPTSFEGELDESGEKVTGVFKQGGGELPLVMEVSEGLAKTTDKQVWIGTMDAGLQTLRMQFRIVEDEDGNESVALDSLTQGVEGITGTYSREDGKVTFEFPNLLAKYEGELDEEKQTITGHWNQSGGKFELNLERKDKPETEEDNQPERPQMPQGPFPYEVEEVKIKNEAADVTLAGTLTRPKGDGPYPAVILVSGSGPQDRDETLLGHKPFWVLADALSRNGIAVLRFDDRGVGDSTGDFGTATSEDFASDAEACFDFLREYETINADAIGIMGHSEGGLIAPIVAARRDDLGFVVLLAGPGVDGTRISLTQSKLIAEVSGASEEDVASQQAFLGRLIERALDPDADEDFETFLNREADKLIAELSEEEQENAEIIRTQLIARTQQFNSPWFKFFLTYDPRPNLEKLKCPVLAVIGEKDLQVPAEENLREIRAALERGGNSDYVVEELPGLNHLFQVSETGMPTEYQSIEETFNQQAIDMIVAWISKRFIAE